MTDPTGDSSPGGTPRRREAVSSGIRLSVSALVGAAAGVIPNLTNSWAIGGLVAWVIAASVFLLWTWVSLWREDAWHTAMLARREAPQRTVTDMLLPGAATASIIAVALAIIIPAGHSGWLLVVLGISCIVVSRMGEGSEGTPSTRRGSAP